MVVQRRKPASSSSAAESETVSAPEEKINVQRTIDELEYALQGKIKNSMAISDTILIKPLQAALADIAKTYFSIDYNPEELTSFYAAVSKNEQIKLYPPSFKAWGESVVLAWGGEIFHLPDDMDCASISTLKLTKRDSGPVILIDAKGYKAEFRVALKAEWTRGEKATDNWFSEYGDLIATIKELSPYLQRGEQLVKWADIEPDTQLQILEMEPVMDRETGTEIAFWYGYTEIDSVPSKIYMPGKPTDWVNYDLDNDLLLTKTDDTTIVDNQGNEYEIGLSFKKMNELAVGKTYVISEVKESNTGNYGLSYSMLMHLEGEESTQKFWVNANTFVKERIKKGLFTPSPENLGFLKVTSHATGNNGKTIVNCTICTQRDLESENTMAKSIEAAAKKAASKTTTSAKKTEKPAGSITF